jgi:hypothetical protein
MWNKTCSNCAKKIEKDFNFCPYCAFPIKKQQEKDDFGMLGKDDSINNEMQNPLALNGMGKILNSLMGQLGKELSGNGMPGNFKIQISTANPMGNPLIRKQQKRKLEKINEVKVNEEEHERRKNLPRQEAESNVRRLSDIIVYEIKVPGVYKKEQIVINRLDTCFEVKAYGDNACYIKTIPLNAELLKSYLKDENLVLELKE